MTLLRPSAHPLELTQPQQAYFVLSPWLLEECDNDELVTELNVYESERVIEIDDTQDPRREHHVLVGFPRTMGTCIQLLRNKAHKEVLSFASPSP